MNHQFQEDLRRPAIDVMTAAKVLGLGRSGAYRAVKDGTLPTFKIGGQYRVPTAKLREMLGLPKQDPATAA